MFIWQRIQGLNVARKIPYNSEKASFLVTKIVYIGYGQLKKWLLFLLPVHSCAPCRRSGRNSRPISAEVAFPRIKPFPSRPISDEVALPRLQSEIKVALFLFASHSFLANNLRFMVKLIVKTIVINQEAWNWWGIFKRTDDHIFEKTLKIEFSPIPQAYPLKRVSDLSCPPPFSVGLTTTTTNNNNNVHKQCENGEGGFKHF
jgi:hypothetical protein